MNPIAEDILIHYGIAKRSGRYPWGSGDDPYQHSGDFLSRVNELKGQGLSEVEIAKAMGFVDERGKTQTTKLRTQVSLAKDERRASEVAAMKSMREDGYSLNEIAEKFGYPNDSSVRSKLNADSESRMKLAKTTADFLKEQVDKNGMIDVGTGIELELGVSSEKMREALYILEMDGYLTYKGRINQVTNPGRKTTIAVLCPPGAEHKDIYDLKDLPSPKNDFVSHDGGDTFDPRFVYPKSMDSKRLKIRYAEEGGVDKDGLVEIRRGVDDLSLGDARYAQVRILVDGKKYIKGMGVYADDLDDGVDVVFNTNKPKGTPKEKVLKDISTDPTNPFGSLIKDGIADPLDVTKKKGGQSYYYDKNGKKQLSLINKRAEEGDWKDWADKLPSQFLGKQSNSLIKKQLGLTFEDKQLEYDDICSLTNPTVKKLLLNSFSDDCDAAAVHLKAAALPRQKYQVILPIPSMKDNEVYAPNYDNGEMVALVRFPHGGTFEIPILKVNNKQADAKRVLGSTPTDAIGINKKVADRMSGADFDGDTVIVIPTSGKVNITTSNPLKGLTGFDPKMEYGADRVETDSTGKEHYYRGDKEFKKMKNTQTEMGKISNLITDMTLVGATNEEKARAVRHSMVVIDSEKHKLDYKQSELENGIQALKKKYQGTYDENGRYHNGAATLLSRASSEKTILKRKGSPKVNQIGKEWYDPNKPEGSLIWNSVEEEYKVYKTIKDPVTGKAKIDPQTGKILKKDTGKTALRTQASTKMAETDNAYDLVSDADTPAERAYADYANKMKALGNQARKEMATTGKINYQASAKDTYQKEVAHLKAQLNVSLRNAPRERQAQIIANAEVTAKKLANPDMTPEEIKKANQLALISARNTVGAKRVPVVISDREWEAIQAGAISENILSKILLNTDIDTIKERATPKTSTKLSKAKIARLNNLKNFGYTSSEIAKALNMPVSTISNYINGKE